MQPHLTLNETLLGMQQQEAQCMVQAEHSLPSTHATEPPSNSAGVVPPSHSLLYAVLYHNNHFYIKLADLYAAV